MTEKDRPSFEEIYMRLAWMMAERSTCHRAQVGCVITSSDFRYVYGVGYNGNAAGLDHGCESLEPGNCACVHGEINAIINCRAARTTPKLIFSTTLPCPMCSKYIINLGGVEKVYYGQDYRIRDGVEHLLKARIPVQLLEVSRNS
jgi:dCMP deaminase